MSQFQPNAAPAKSFISKINSKFSSLSLSNTIQSIHSDKDGDSPDDTLIHNAFVKYFDSNREQYPEWLGVKKQEPRLNSAPYSSRLYQNQQQYQPQQYQPKTYQPQQYQSQSSPSFQNQRLYEDQTQTAPQPQKQAYTPRSSSRLLDLYNKSRQQAVPGAGYNAQSAPARSNTSGSTHSSRLRQGVMSSPSMNGISQTAQNGSRATWGKK